MQKIQNFSVLFGLTLAVLLISFRTTAAETKFIHYDALAMHQIKKSLNSNESPHPRVIAYRQLLKTAEKLLAQPVPSVMEKTFTPPSGDKHDYLSLSRYWWPDPAKADGLPWVRKDGVTNPSTQTDDVDRRKMGTMAKMVQILSLAYYLSGQEKYAEKAAIVLRTWFIAPDTKMNPHLRFAQSVPGNPSERRSGILDGRLIPQYVLDAIHILSASSHWQESDTQNMNAWLNEYFIWLTQSDLGKQGAKQTNNHGSWYYFQVASLAYYLDEQAVLAKTIEQVKASYEYQFDELGRQPHELARTRSFFYSCFNLEAITNVALLADKVNQSFWQYQSKNGASLELAIEFLLPAVSGQEWKYKTTGVEPMVVVPLLVKFDKKMQHKKYAVTLYRIITDATQSIKTGTSKDNTVAHKYASTITSRLALFDPHYFLHHDSELKP